MNDFLQGLPIRVASLAGLVVGVVSWYNGTTLIGCLERIAIAIAIFGVLAVILRALIQAFGAQDPEQRNDLGRHIDAKTPTITAADLGESESGHWGE